MIKEFVLKWEENKNKVEDFIKSNISDYFSYQGLLKIIIEYALDVDDEYGCIPDSSNIHTIDDGDYQGTLLLIIPEKGYQPSTYWAVKMYYGSCSYCDTMQSINEESDMDIKLKDLMGECLHLVQGLTKI